MSKLYVNEIHPKTAGGTVTISDAVISNVPTTSSYFYADRNAGDVGATNTIIFESVISNEGNDYSNTTGIYTAPVNGLYWFSNTFLSTTANDTDVEIRIDNVSGSSAFGKHRVNTDANHASSSWSGVTYLNAGQNVRCVVTNNTVHGGGSRWTVFTGYLIR